MALNIGKELNQFLSLANFHNKKEDEKTEIKNLEIDQISISKKSLEVSCSYLTKFKGKTYHCSAII